MQGRQGRRGGSNLPVRQPDPEVLADDGSPQRGGAAAGPPRGIEPRPPLALVPAGGPSRRVESAVESQKTTCSSIVRNIDMPSRMRNSTPVHAVHRVNRERVSWGCVGVGFVRVLGRGVATEAGRPMDPALRSTAEVRSHDDGQEGGAGLGGAKVDGGEATGHLHPRTPLSPLLVGVWARECGTH